MIMLIVTGMSGSGKSAATDALEDLGYFCIDNMPPSLIPTIAQFIMRSDSSKKVATVTDIRAGEKALKDFDSAFETLKKIDIDYKILFVDASDDVLIRRFKETRRKHPLIDECDNSLKQSIEKERQFLLPIRAVADYVIDTSNITAAECKQRVNELFLDNPDMLLKLRCISFGFKHGIPSDADIVLDVRCLPNPFYIPELKHKTGLDKEICDYIMSFEQSREVLKKLTDLFDYMLPLYKKEGKSQLVVAFGCTGGHHRSVCFAEYIGKHFGEKGYSTSISHRDIYK